MRNMAFNNWTFRVTGTDLLIFSGCTGLLILFFKGAFGIGEMIAGAVFGAEVRELAGWARLGATGIVLSTGAASAVVLALAAMPRAVRWLEAREIKAGEETGEATWT